jgi:hypothetical protein
MKGNGFLWALAMPLLIQLLVGFSLLFNVTVSGPCFLFLGSGLLLIHY